jgi:protein-tyrosine phosphatase
VKPYSIKPIRSVLFVCMGNICRSPMAEGLLRHRLTERGLDDRLRIDSAGIGGWHAGSAPDLRAIRVCAESGIDIGAQRARMVCTDDYMEFDLILCVDHDTLRTVDFLQPAGTTAQIALLLDWAGVTDGAGFPNAEVPDPYQGAIEDFRRLYRLLDGATGGLLARLQLSA